MKNNCEWEQEDEYHEAFDTDCGEVFSVTSDPHNLGDWAKFCIYCGKPLKVKIWEHPEESEAQG